MKLPFLLIEFSETFLKNDILCIDIGFANIKVVHARRKSNNLLRVINFGICSTPSHCIKDGIISNIEGIAENLKKVICEQGIRERNVKILISAGSNIISKVFYVLKADEKKVEVQIREKISKNISTDIQSNRLFYRIIAETEKEEQKYYRVLVTVVPNTTMENYIKLIKFLEFKPVSIEIPFSCVARFFSKGVKVPEKDNWYYNDMFADICKGSSAIVDLGSETTSLSIVNNRALEFSRVILIGGRNLDEMIAEKLGIKAEIAEEYKKMHGLDSEKHMEDEIKQVVDECARDFLWKVMYNIKRSIDFYIDTCGGEPVERFFFIGGGSALNGLKKFSQDIFGKTVYTIENIELKNIEFEGRLDKDKLRFLVNALGLAM